MPCELVTWGQVERLAAKLAMKVKQAAYQPDIVIAIARGGYVPARLICDHMDIFNLTSIRIVHYEAGARMLKNARLSMPLCTDVENLNVLLVDDVSDTGDTLRLAVSHIREFKPADIKIAVLDHKVVSRLVPDFYARKILKWRWLTYPWAIREDLGQFLKAQQSCLHSVEQAAAYLEEQYGIHPPRKILEEILKSTG